MLDEGLLVIRLVLGIILLGHGVQKVFGWFGGYGIKGTGKWLESIGIKPGAFFAFITGAAEIVGGFFVAAGVYTEIGAWLIIVVMAVAVLKVHIKNGFWNTSNGFEFNLLIIAAAIGLLLTGPGSMVLF
ncbi:oxidoreductase [Bacillus sp. AFS001701]|uniref:DoxX family protein n=1 Tax=Bacillaceae TaxID=186817 RepID=UPI000BF90F3C|nr:DoxX family protein [Bacillus sp. AFS001701]PET55119.1 oxidoreductase [Bacillus sp. AFS001701]